MRSRQVAAPPAPAAQGAPALRVRLLGGLQIHRDGVLLPPLESARAESLLAYLLLHRGAPQPRQRVAYLLWPDSTESQARTNLRHVLHNLRRGFPDAEDFLEITPRALCWRADAPYALDVAEFEALLDAAEAGPADARAAALAEAVERYPGDLLEGRYDEWLLGERERLRQRFLAALADLAALCEAGGDHAGAVRHAERLLRADPLREAACRLLMRSAHAMGDQARALRAYHVCASTLERELGVAPSEETRRLYESLLPAAIAAEPAVGPPLVGRGRERTVLTGAWRRAAAGRAEFVLITGEPGIGKTRLVEDFARWCGHRGAAVAEARCYPAEGVLAYAPVVAWLRSGTLRPYLDRLEPARITELARLAPELLGDVPGLAAPRPLPEGEQRQRLFDAVAAAIRAAGEPLLLVVDDLQWCDQQTLRFLHYLLRLAPGARLMIAATARLEELDDRHPLQDLLTALRLRDRLTEIELARLTPVETAALASGLTAARPSAAESQRLYRETEGNPLFVIEAVRAGASSSKVQAVIGARLARLSESARELAGLAAAIGGEFTSELLGAAGEHGEAVLVRDLDELWRRRIIREQGLDGYDFSHGKLRDVAYQSLTPARRRLHHRRIAEALRRDPEPARSQVAEHYERAGALEPAVHWYADAADAAQLLHANEEAVRLLERALDLLRRQPVSRARAERELALLTVLPAPLGAVDGYGSGRLDAIQRRAQELAARLEVDLAPPMLRSLAIVALVRGDFGEAHRSGERLLTQGERDADEMLVVEGSYVLGIAAFWQGRFEAARRHFEEAVRRYRPDQRSTHLLRYGIDPQVLCLSRLGNTEWFLGDPEAAVARREAALALADKIGHPFSKGVVLVFAALLALDMGDEPALRQHTEELVAHHNASRPNGTMGAALRGYVEVLDGDVASGVGRILAAIDDIKGGGQSAPGQHACLQRVLLAAYQAAGDSRAALETAERLIGMGGGAAVWEAEARRVRSAFRVRAR